MNHKYTTKITMRNDSVPMVGDNLGYYREDTNETYIRKGDMNLSDFGIGNPQTEEEEYLDLVIIHENQHKINHTVHKVGQTNLSLYEQYQVDAHDEITAEIAARLEIRRQYKEATTPEAKQAVLQKYLPMPEYKNYIKAIQTGKINPDSHSTADFAKEMTFIKTDAQNSYANNDTYQENWMRFAKSHLQKHHTLQSNPAVMSAEIHRMYQIGGIDFTKYGNHNDNVFENQNLTAADNYLNQGVAPEKVIAFIDASTGSFKDPNVFKLAETLDVSGLSREQAEKVIQTAIITQYLQKDITRDLVVGDEPAYNYVFIADYLQEQTAFYLDLKSDIWEKNNTLSEQGDEEKFNRLMQQAQTLTLDPTAAKDGILWCINHRTPPFTDKELKTIKQNITSLHGKTVNFNDVVTNSDKLCLPLDDTNVAEVIATKRQKDEEEEKWWEEYNATHQQEQPRLSDPYEIEIMDLQSSILSDELQHRQQCENTIEPMFSPINTQQYASTDGTMSLTSQYANAEFITTQNPDGSSSEVVLIDGKKHGAEITTNANGEKSFILYNHGKEVDLTQNSVDIVNETQNGALHSYILLNGKKFGIETMTAPDGTTKAEFYEKSGFRIANTTESKITKKTIDFKDDLSAQQGQLTENPIAHSQSMRIDSRWQQHQNTASPAQKQSAQTNTDSIQTTANFVLSTLEKTR